MTDEELVAVLASPLRGRRRPRSLTGYRNWVMFRVLAHTGLRSQELLSLDVSDVTLSGVNAGRIQVRNGKGGRDRVVGLSAPDLSILRDEYLKEWGISSGPLFRSLTTGERLAYDSLKKQVRRHALLAGVAPGKNITPHTFRHSYATRLYRSHKNLVAVSHALGHSSVRTTQSYVHVDASEVIDQMASIALPV